MFLLPYYHGKHFSLVVVNIVASSIQFLDNIHYADPKWCYELAETVRGEFSTFLDSLYHPKAREVLEYALEMVDFPWTVNENNDEFTLCILWSNLTEAATLHRLKRRLYRASVCARLATCDVNKVRGQLLEKVAQFTNGKVSTTSDVEKQKKSRRQDLVAAPKKSRRGPRI